MACMVHPAKTNVLPQGGIGSWHQVLFARILQAQQLHITMHHYRDMPNTGDHNG